MKTAHFRYWCEVKPDPKAPWMKSRMLYFEVGAIDGPAKYIPGLPACYIPGYVENMMMATGLKDKDGKIIWEGDILAHPNDSLPNYFVVYWDEQSAKFSTKLMRMHNKMIGVPNVNSDSWKNMKIVGNIHENPELIKC